MKPVASSGAPRAIGPYAQGVAAGGFVFLSGQVPLDPRSGELIGGTIEVQVARVMENLGAVLEAAGSGFAHVVKTTVFLTDLADFQKMNGVYEQFLKDNRPARSTVQVAALPKGARVEIDAIARLK